MKKRAICMLLAISVAALLAEYAPHSIVDTMPPVNLPELLKASDGTEVKTVAEWETKRRPELLDFFTRNMHGIRPVERPADLSFSPIAPDCEMCGGSIVRKQVRVSFSGPYGKWGFDILAFLPKASRPVPAFIFICNRALEKNVDPELKVKSEFCPVEAMTAMGTVPVTTMGTVPVFAIGPEGGWTDVEVVALEAHGFTRHALGPRILKTETAAIALLSRFM